MCFVKYITNMAVHSHLVRVHGVNWIGDKSRLSATENFETVLSSLKMRCELSLDLFSNAFTPQTRQNHSVSNILKTVCDCRDLSSHCRQDKTVFVLSMFMCELTIMLLALLIANCGTCVRWQCGLDMAHGVLGPYSSLLLRIFHQKKVTCDLLN